MKTFGDKATAYFLSLQSPAKLNDGITAMNPYENPEVQKIVKEFFHCHYNDSRERAFIIGINPGRFGAGTTGIGFTDPVALRKYCGIENELGSKKELSSEFIYSMIQEFGGVRDFYSSFYLSALYPLALIKENKNYNYYDDPELLASMTPLIKEALKKQIAFGARKDIAFCLGKKNMVYLEKINDELKLFKEIILLEHPRFIMQYKRKNLHQYIGKYLEAFNGAI